MNWPGRGTGRDGAAGELVPGSRLTARAVAAAAAVAPSRTGRSQDGWRGRDAARGGYAGSGLSAKPRSA
jgi:hypothetical protein